MYWLCLLTKRTVLDGNSMQSRDVFSSRDTYCPFPDALGATLQNDTSGSGKEAPSHGAHVFLGVHNVSKRTVYVDQPILFVHKGI